MPQQIGPGFAEQSSEDGIGEAAMSSECKALNGPSPSLMAMRAFVKDPSSLGITEVTEELLQFTPSQAEGQIQLFTNVAAACPVFGFDIGTSAGQMHVQISVSQEAFPGYGDQAAAVRLTADATLQGQTTVVYADIVAVRYGGTIILVVNVALHPDTPLTASIVKAAYDRAVARW